MKIRFLYFILILVVFLGCKKDKNIEDNIEDNEIIIQTDYRDKVVGYYGCSWSSFGFSASSGNYSNNGFDTILVVKDSVSQQLIHFLLNNHDQWPLGKVLNTDYSLNGYKINEYFSGSFTLGDSSITLHLSYGGQSPGGTWNTNRNGVKL